MSEVSFTVHGKPMAQGSMTPFIDKRSGQARMKPTNKGMLPYRQEVAQTAHVEFRGRMFGKHEPVELEVQFWISRPAGAPKKRTHPAVKPDLDKLVRLVNDALTGIAYLDDGQVCKVTAQKFYGTPERTEITVRAVGVQG